MPSAEAIETSEYIRSHDGIYASSVVIEVCLTVEIRMMLSGMNAGIHTKNIPSGVTHRAIWSRVE